MNDTYSAISRQGILALLGILAIASPLPAGNNLEFVEDLRAHTVVFVDIQDLRALATSMAKTPFGRILAMRNVAPIARAALESIEPRYLSAYRGVLGIPKWRILSSYEGGYRYVVTSSAVGHFEQLSIFKTRSPESARSLLDRIEKDHQDVGGSISKELFDGVSLTVLERNGYNPNRYAIADRNIVIVASTPQCALEYLASRQEKSADESSREMTEWKKWFVLSQDAPGLPQPAIVAFINAKSLFVHQPMIGYMAKVLLGRDFDGWRYLSGSVTFPPHPYSMVVRVHLNRTADQRGTLGPVAWGHGSTRVPDWVNATFSSSTVLRTDPVGTWQRINDRFGRAAGEEDSEAGVEQFLMKWLGKEIADTPSEATTGRVTIARWFEKPAKLNSKSILLGIELKRPDQVRKSLRRAAVRTPETLESRRFRSVDYFVVRRPFKISVNADGRVELIPWNAPATPLLRRPSNCLGVVGTDLVYSDNENALKEAIRAFQLEAERLNRALPYKLMATHLRRVSNGNVVGASYWDPSESWENLHSLLSRKEMIQAIKSYQNPFVQVSQLSAAVKNRKEIAFYEIARHLTPCGSTISVSGNDIQWRFVMLSRGEQD